MPQELVPGSIEILQMPCFRQRPDTAPRMICQVGDQEYRATFQAAYRARRHLSSLAGYIYFIPA